MKKIILMLLVLTPLTFTACDDGHPELEIFLDADYSEVIAAIKDANRSLSDRVALIEAAVNSGLAESDALMGLIREALATLGGTMEEKLAAIEAAVKSQTTALETKLALVEAAVSGGFADSAAQQALLQDALATLGGSLEEQVASLESAVKDQTTSLQTKLALLDEAVGLLDSVQQLALIREAVAAVEATAEEKMDAVAQLLQQQTTTLETKFGLIATALEQGFADQATAIEAAKTALDSSLTDLDDSLLQMKDAFVSQLEAVAGQLSPEELSKACQGIIQAIDSRTQTTAGMLNAMLKTVAGLEEIVKTVSYSLVFVGDPAATDTVTKGETFTVTLLVDPDTAVLVKDRLHIDVLSRKLFYPEGAGTGTEPDHFILTALDKDPGTPGQYVATISTHSTVGVWDESLLALKYDFGYKGQAKFVTADPFPVVMMPRAKDALLCGYYPNASFQMRDTVFEGGNKTIVDTLGVIYYALGSVTFQTEDRKDSRIYSADNLVSAHFIQPDRPDTASLFTRLDKEKHFVSFCPDTTGNQAWRDFKGKYATAHDYQEVSGKLALTDQWGATDSLDLEMKWFVTWPPVYEIVDDGQDTLKPSHFVPTGQTYARKYPEIWTLHLRPWGLDYEIIRRCGLELESVTRGCGDGYKLLRLNLSSGPSSTCLEVADGVKPVTGDKYQTLGVFRLRGKPSDVDPSFRPTQILYKYQVKLMVKQEDDTQ